MKIKKYISKHYNLFRYFDVRYYSYKLSYEYSNKNGITHKKRFETFYYLRKLFATIIQVSELLLVGLLIGRLKEMIIAMICIQSLRNYLGGWHGKSLIQCLIITTFFMLLAIYVGNIINLYIIIILLVMSFIIILCKKNIKGLLVYLFWTIMVFIFSYKGLIATSVFIECFNSIELKCWPAHKKHKEG